ncbi:MAG: hypothetical protein B7Z75_13745 [Acidocella sp. 20-57-95]|nr:MAG: hypothetical protein B7Z75_13745 [Acidocella sp. 20-57-95]HQT65824.1 hypothetical protein [Acidocella sp.]
MDRRSFAALMLTSAIAFASVAPGIANAQGMPMPQQPMMQTQQTNKTNIKPGHLKTSYNVNAVDKNDCTTGANCCAGQTKANDPAS